MADTKTPDPDNTAYILEDGTIVMPPVKVEGRDPDKDLEEAEIVEAETVKPEGYAFATPVTDIPAAEANSAPISLTSPVSPPLARTVVADAAPVNAQTSPAAVQAVAPAQQQAIASDAIRAATNIPAPIVAQSPSETVAPVSNQTVQNTIASPVAQAAAPVQQPAVAAEIAAHATSIPDNAVTLAPPETASVQNAPRAERVATPDLAHAVTPATTTTTIATDITEQAPVQNHAQVHQVPTSDVVQAAGPATARVAEANPAPASGVSPAEVKPAPTFLQNLTSIFISSANAAAPVSPPAGPQVQQIPETTASTVAATSVAALPDTPEIIKPGIAETVAAQSPAIETAIPVQASAATAISTVQPEQQEAAHLVAASEIKPVDSIPAQTAIEPKIEDAPILSGQFAAANRNAAAQNPEKPQYTDHKVTSGQSLWEIARKAGNFEKNDHKAIAEAVRSIAHANDIADGTKPNSIRVGQTLKIPANLKEATESGKPDLNWKALHEQTMSRKLSNQFAHAANGAAPIATPAPVQSPVRGVANTNKRTKTA